jgi:hypothetical protein
VEANSDNRYVEVCHHWAGSVLGPKSVAKLEKAKAKELTIKWAKCAMLSSLHIMTIKTIPLKKKEILLIKSVVILIF